MQWILPGRISRIEYATSIVYLKAQGNDVFPIQIQFDQPRFFARLDLVPPAFDVPVGQAYPAIVPRLGSDIAVGDYVRVIPRPAVYDARYLLSNNIPPQQVYQKLSAARNDGVKIASQFIEIIQ